MVVGWYRGMVVVFINTGEKMKPTFCSGNSCSSYLQRSMAGEQDKELQLVV